MTQQEKGKNIFQQAVDAVTNRDEKAAVEAAMKKAQELEQRAVQAEKSLADAQSKVTQLTSDLQNTQRELEITRSDLITAKNTVTVVQGRLDATNQELQKYVSAEQAKQIAEAAAAAERAQIIAEHTLTPDETLSHLALKYYGFGYEPYWRVIYNANKELIGDNPGHVHPGMVIKIPVLPDELKKK